MEPYDTKLSVDTWYYAKRCVLAVLDLVAKQAMILKDDFYDELVAFLDALQQPGESILTVVPSPEMTIDPVVHNVAYEARVLKRILYKLRETG